MPNGVRFAGHQPTVPYVCVLLSLIGLLSDGPAGYSSESTVSKGAISRELLGLEHALAMTLLTRDKAVMERLLDDEFVLRSEPDTSRTTWMQNAMTRCWGDRFEITGFTAQASEDIAVAAFELTLHVNPATCQPGTIRSLVTDVWVLRENGWRLRVRHSGPPVAASSGMAGQYALLPQRAPTWKIDSELSFVATGGTTSTRTLGLASDVFHQESGKNTRVQVSFVTSEADDATRARAIDAQARHGVTVGDGLDIFGRVGYTRDRFAGIASRTVLESGLAYTATDTPVQTLALEASGGFTSEGHIGSPDQQFAVTTGAVSYRRKITPTSEINDDVSVTADLVSIDNWRMRNALNFQATLTRLLSLKLSHSFEYRNVPVPGFGRLDTRTSAALVFSFRRIPPPR
jgi:putative salt-induced outer membrane protein YdiY